MITETEPVKEVLDELRRVQGGEKVELPDLVIRGAKAKIRELEAEGEPSRQAGREIAEWIRSADGPQVDIEAAAEVKQLGLEPNYDE